MRLKYFDFRDILLTPRLSLSWKKISIHVFGIFAGWFIYFLLTYIALLVNGLTIKQIWLRHYLFPIIFNTDLPIQWYVYVISGIGISIWILIYIYSSTAVSRITYEQLKRNNYFSTKESLLFAKKHFFAPIFTPVIISLIIFFFILIFCLIALLTKIPFFDILFLGFPFILYFISSIFIIYTILIWIISLFLSPAVVATAEEDTLETIFQNYSSFWNQPWRIIIYEILNIGLSILVTFIFSCFYFFAYKLLNICFSFAIFSNNKADTILRHASSYIYGNHSPITPHIPFIFQIEPEKLINQYNLSITESFSTFLVVISLFFITISIFAYFLVNINIGQTLIYLIIRKRKDEENLIDRKETDELKEKDKKNLKIN